jgi:Tol biopolymer transport system component/Ca2+-binding RTX toxin-like protein
LLGGFGSSADGHIDSLSKGADTFTVPDAHLLFSGDFLRSGADLIISDQLHRVVVPNYFNGDKRPALVSPEGAPLDPKFIDALTGHVQYAQAAGTAAAPKVVGHVVKMTGSASIVRNGVTIDVNNGDIVYQNDVVQTGSGSTLGLVMIDGTTFNLTANARLMMNDLTYDATSTSNTSLFTLVQGAANFVAGQVAKTGDMKVSTPVATMGIRGTAAILDFSAIDGAVTVSVVDQRDGQIHALQVYNARGDLIGTVVSNGRTLTLRPTATFEVIAQESNKTVAQVAAEFNAFQQLLSTYEIGKQLFPDTPFPTDGRRGDNTQQPLTKFAGSTISPIDSTSTKFNAEIGSTRAINGDAGTDDALRPIGETTDLVTRIALSSGDDPAKEVQFVDVPATSIPFVVTPSPVSRISSGPGDHFGPAMSADGQFVTYDPDGVIYLFDRQTGATKTIAAPGGGFTYGSPTISSDGHFVVYQGSDGTQSWVFIYNNDASDAAHYGQTSRLVSGGQPAISGDGSRLVIEQGGSIALYDQQGHQLANFTGASVGITGALWKPAISADGHIIAFWSSDLSSPGGAGKLFTYDLSTATVRSIGSTATGAGDSAASFSADGHYVVYQSDAPDGHSEIYLYDLRAGQVVFKTANPDPSYNPVLSPDGHFIILASDVRLTTDDKNNIADIYVIDVTDPSHPLYKLVSVLDDGTQGDDASNLGAAISAGGQFFAFGSRASNFSGGDTAGSGDIFVVDPTSGHSAIILESRNSPATLTTSGVIKLTGEHSGVTLGVSDSRITASFDSHGDIQWSFSEPRSDFATLQPGQLSVLNFVITLSTTVSTTEIPVKVSVYDVDQPVVVVADAAPVASPVTLAAGTEDTGYTITSAALLAGVVDIDGPSLSITAVGVISGGGSIVDNHNGTFSYTPAPNYNGPVVFNYTASDGTLSASSTASLNVGAVNDAPVVTKAAFAVSEGGTVVLGAANIAAFDLDSANFTFTVSSVAHGTFQTTVNGSVWTNAAIFTTADLNAGHVRFVHDGGELAPTFSIQANDGAGSNSLSSVVAGSVSYTNVNDAPVLALASLMVSEGGTVMLGASNIGVTDPDSTSFTFTASNVSHGTFQTTTNGANWVAATTFTTADLNAGHVRFVHDGGELAPTFSLQADDGAGTNSLSNVLAGNVIFSNANDAPVLTLASMMVSEGGTVALGASNIGVIDPDSTSFTFTASNVSRGKFETTANGASWVAATTFTTADLNAGHVRFVHDGGELAPTFSLQADDGAGSNSLSNVLGGSVVFTHVNDAPVVTNAAMTVPEGGTVVLNAANIGISDPDSTSFTFVVSNVSHGTFQTTVDSTHWAAATTFTTADLNANHVRFVHDGGEDAPTFSLQANDGAGSNSLSNVIAGSVTFTHVNDAPEVTVPATHYNATEQTDLSLRNAGLSISDADGNGSTETVTLAVGEGILTIAAGDSGVSNISGNGTGSVTFSGSVAQINALLNSSTGSIVYNDGTDTPGASTKLTLTAHDNGNSGEGGDQVGIASATIDITAVDDAPVIRGGDPRSLSVAENTTTVGTVVTDDPDGPSLTYSLVIGSGSPDASKFTIDSANGALSFVNAPDFGYPTDSDHDNIYTVEVRVSDGTLSDTQTLLVQVTDVNDSAPVITTNSSQSVAENHTFVTHLSAFDVDGVGGPTVLSIADGSDGSLFEIVDGNLRFKAAPDFEHPSDANENNIYSVTVNASDGLNSSAKTFSVHVTNVNEAPVLAPNTNAVTYVENAARLALMSAGSVTDPDNPSNFDDGSISVTLNGAVSGDELVLATGGHLSLSGSSVRFDGTTIGTISGNHSTHLTVEFNSNATDAKVETVLKALSFDSTSDNPTNADRTATVTFNDGSNDGSGPALSDSSTVTIHVTPVNDAPHAGNDIVITNNANNSRYEIPNWALLANDTDPDSNVLSLTAITASSEFTSIDLTTNPGNVTIHDLFVGGSFTYRASDGSLSDTANVTVAQDTGTMNGGFGNEIFIGDSNGTTINANGGNDILIGNAGNDILNGGSGNDTYAFGLRDGQDTIHDSSGLDTIRIEAGGHELTGLNFAEDAHDNLVIKFDGQQITVTDHFAGDRNVGGLTFDGGASYDGYDLGSGTYYLSNDSGFNRSGTSGNDILSGDGAANNIGGGDGNDLLFGNAGSDTLNGGSGNDLLTGGSASDQFVFAAGFGKDIITDFESGHDKIDLFAVVSTNDVDGWIHDHVTASPTNAADTLITIDASNTITLHNVLAASLHAGDLIVHP